MLRLVLLWHMHQPFYKDLISGEYRLPWVRLHALKDYYGMVKLLDEFPRVHQTFNLVPSLIAQIQDYVSGSARDPFLDLAARPARDLTPDDRHLALAYLFQANVAHMIGRYPRYRELWERFRGLGQNPARSEQFFKPQDVTDLQVLSQLAWFDEFFLEDPAVSALITKGRNYSEEDQRFIIARQQELIKIVLPAYQAAAKRGAIEISASPFYHPILPLLCDTNQGAVSTPGLALPAMPYQHPEDAREQLQRGLDLHQRVFGVRPIGVWPSEGSVSEEVIAIAAKLGIRWMATDEGVLGRTLDYQFERDSERRLVKDGARKLYTIYRFEEKDAAMHLLFRDRMLSDLIGFVYSGMPAQEAAVHLMQSIKDSAQSLISQGKDAVVSLILDGENAWEFYPRSGREFLRRFYDALQRDPEIEAVTVSEAIARQREFAGLSSLLPGSWINANFNIWIGADEDNLAWNYLAQARDFYSRTAPNVGEAQRALAYEELLVAEGSDWNWWYGPEHHSVNDRDFDELYRKHLSNVYHALGAPPPDGLGQPIAIAALTRPSYVPQTAYIHPEITGRLVRYFDWIGAATYTADRRSGAMHGKQFLLDSVYAGIDEVNLYGRADFAYEVPLGKFDLVVQIEDKADAKPQSGDAATAAPAVRTLRLEVAFDQRQMRDWKLYSADPERLLASMATARDSGVELALENDFEFMLPLALLYEDKPKVEIAFEKGSALRLRFSLWRDHLPADALPLEGWIELDLLPEQDLIARG